MNTIENQKMTLNHGHVGEGGFVIVWCWGCWGSIFLSR